MNTDPRHYRDCQLDGCADVETVRCSNCDQIAEDYDNECRYCGANICREH